MKTNLLKHPALATMTLALSIATAPAATSLLSTNLQSLSTGAVTAANLTSVTTGGTWALNTGRSGTAYTIDGTTDRAFLADDSDVTGNDGTQVFATVTLNTVADFSTDAVTWDFRTATRRTGAGKGLRYEFLNNTTVVATLDWFDGGSVTLTGTGMDTSTETFSFLSTWGDGTSTAIKDFSAVFSSTGLALNFEDDVLSVALGSTSIDRMIVSSISNGGFAAERRGVFLDEISVTQVPEPSAAVLGSLGLLYLLRRRR
jgi:hypothetical protein